MYKLKRVIFTVIMLLTILIFITPLTKVYAKEASTPLILGITELRTGSTPNMGYAIGDPNTNEQEGNAAKLWNIVKYDSMSASNFEEINAYCVKAGVGFSNTGEKATYNLFYDMRTEKDEINKNISSMQATISGTIPGENGTQINRYDALLALLDMIYLDGDKWDLLESAGIYEGDYDKEDEITIDDIEAVQQAAIWYFTNYEEKTKYDKTEDENWLNYTLNGKDYDNLSNYRPDPQDIPQESEGFYRNEQAEALYKHLIREAKKNANNYSSDEETGAPIELETTILSYEEEGEKYIFGPIKFNQKNSKPYTLDFTVKNGGTQVQDYKILNSQKQEMPSGTTAKDMVGQDFYISMPKDGVTTITIETNIKYNNTKLTLWANKTEDEQPVVIPEKEEVEVPGKLTSTPEHKEFDLALRKYITQINGQNVQNTRVPNIDEARLRTGTTATYKHRKDPIEVKTGNKVTYRITIYNEGEKAGRATKIVDQLPTGLKFTQVLSGNFELESYNEQTDNKLTLKRKSGNENNLPAYSQENLSSETIEIECEVTATPDSTGDKVLTNVAWISEEYDAESGITITNKQGDDRDSEPSTTPSVNKDNMSNYTGNNNKTDLTDPAYYYKGQQDDDDFEKVVLKQATGGYNLQVLKVDTDNPQKKLSGAQFKITLPDKTEITEKTDENGILNIPTINITQEGTEQIKIEEIKAPEGYEKLIGTINLEITKQLVDGNYKITNVTQIGETTDYQEVTLEGQTIKVTIENKLLQGVYNLQVLKVDEQNADTKLNGAKFKITLPDGSQREETTNSDGIINITGIKINEEGIDTIKVEEITPPTGYDKIFNSFEIKVTKTQSNGEYIVSNVEIANIENSQTSTSSITVENDNNTIQVTVPNKRITEGYSLQILKVDEQDTNTKLSGAKFNITLPDGSQREETTNSDGIINITGIKIDEEGIDTIKIEEITPPTEYEKIFNSFEIKVTKTQSNGEYIVSDIEITNIENGQNSEAEIVADNTNNTVQVTVPNKKITGGYSLQIVKVDEQNENTKLEGAQFKVTLPDGSQQDVTTNDQGIIDISGIAINEEGTDTIKVEEITPPAGYTKIFNSFEIKVTKTQSNGEYIVSNVEITNIENGQTSEAEITVDNTNNTIQVTVPNKKITGDYNLQLIKQDKQDTNIKLEGARFKITLPDGSQRNVTTNAQGIIDISAIAINEEGTDTITIEETVPPTGYNKLIGTITLELTKEVVNGNYQITNVEITQGQVDGVTVTQDGKTIAITIPNEEIKIPVDFKLIKRIVAVNNQNVPERIEDVDVSKLNTQDENGNLITTGKYTISKEPVGVKKGDIVTYTFRVYNEGFIDGYVQEITEDIPEGLEFIWSEKEGQELENDETLTEEEKEAIEFNQRYLWGDFVYDENRERIIQISTDYLSKENETTQGGNLIPAFGENDGTKTEEDIHYKEVSVKLKVISENITGTIIRNESAITDDCDENGDSVDDRDSSTEEWEKYEDDEDFDNIILQSFDLALRKFIIAVSEDEQIEDGEYLRNENGLYTRAPEVDTSLLNTKDENGNLITTAIYNHTKEPVLVQPNDIVVYMLRVYNEGDMDGYAAEIKDHLPPYLEYIESEFNNQYNWEVSEDGRTVTTRYLENELIEKAQEGEDGKIVLTYKEVPIMCKVKENSPTSENITNIADITEYQNENKEPTTDRDSQEDNVELPNDEELPGYKDEETGEYIPGQQDDDDFEKVIVKIFDLSLRKWVTQAIVIEDGKESVIETGHKPYDDPEQVVKVEIHRKKIEDVTVKFRYSIRVANEGEIEGYAKEITDYIPQGLKFVAEDNPGWTDEGNNIVSTRLLENTLLKPGEYAEVQILLTWINDSENMGTMINTAEISEDYNDYDVPDKDSTPDNKEPGEDDIDDAPVTLSVATGQARIYFTLGFIILITIAGGIILIKRFVI